MLRISKEIYIQFTVTRRRKYLTKYKINTHEINVIYWLRSFLSLISLNIFFCLSILTHKWTCYEFSTSSIVNIERFLSEVWFLSFVQISRTAENFGISGKWDFFANICSIYSVIWNHLIIWNVNLAFVFQNVS